MASRWVEIVFPKTKKVDESKRIELTEKQITWAHRVYDVDGDGRAECHFPMYDEVRGWHICGRDDSVHIHHVKPQRYSTRVLREEPNVATNLIALCPHHHNGVGYQGNLDWRNEVVPIVHADMEWARRIYATNQKSFDTVFKGRDQRTKQGRTYWNTDWDAALLEIARIKVTKYLLEHPNDPFPKHVFRQK